MLDNALSNKVPPSHRTVTNQYTKHLPSCDFRDNFWNHVISDVVEVEP